MKLLYSLFFSLFFSSVAMANTSYWDINLEPLYGHMHNEKGITFQVYSSGCTNKDYFTVHIMESWPLQVLLVRVRQDPCDAYLPYGTTVTYSWKELNMGPGSQFRIVNPIQEGMVAY